MQNKYQFKFTRLALLDIDEVMSYISFNLANPQAAKSLYNEIEKAITQICEFPYAYADCSHYMIENENIRHIKIGNYILIYEISKSSSTLHILRFCYSMMDITRLEMK